MYLPAWPFLIQVVKVAETAIGKGTGIRKHI
jgi:hypothetical protein